jgi:hypothetical protein
MKNNKCQTWLMGEGHQNKGNFLRNTAGEGNRTLLKGV